MNRKLLLSLVLMLHLGAAPAFAEGIGAYFTLVNTYVYTDGPRAGNRLLVRPRLAFVVVDLSSDANDRIWYQIIYPSRNTKVSGEGWTAAAAHELLADAGNPILVFSRVPDHSDRSFTSLQVPVSGIKLLNKTQPSTIFSQIVWQKVHYTLTRPLRVWTRAAAGIYRPGKTDAFMSRAYGEMITRNVGKDQLRRLLSGVVRVGDSAQEVRWALGDPLRTQDEVVGEVRRNTWQYPELTVQFENDVVKQIN